MTWVNYSGTQFQQFWSRCGEGNIHPDDVPFFTADKALAGEVVAGRLRIPANFETEQYLPCPFDGPIDKARVIICLANPNYTNLDACCVNGIVKGQRCGSVDLPKEWDTYYQPRIGNPIGVGMSDLRGQLAILNLCPYSSPYLEGAETRLAVGLPSVWAAQKYFREVLVPNATVGEIFLVVGRKHLLWGVHEGLRSPNIAVTRKNALSGRLTDDIGRTIRAWLERKGALQTTSVNSPE